MSLERVQLLPGAQEAPGELLAAYQGTQPVGKDYQENTPMNKASNLKEHFTAWGKNISQRLATAQAR